MATLPSIFGQFLGCINVPSRLPLLFGLFLWTLWTDCLWQHKIWAILKRYTKFFEVKLWKTSPSVIALTCALGKKETSKLPYHMARFCLSFLSFHPVLKRINVALLCLWNYWCRTLQVFNIACVQLLIGMWVGIWHLEYSSKREYSLILVRAEKPDTVYIFTDTITLKNSTEWKNNYNTFPEPTHNFSIRDFSGYIVYAQVMQ